jgi:hypothetical protein
LTIAHRLLFFHPFIIAQHLLTIISLTFLLEVNGYDEDEGLEDDDEQEAEVEVAAASNDTTKSKKGKAKSKLPAQEFESGCVKSVWALVKMTSEKVRGPLIELLRAC